MNKLGHFIFSNKSKIELHFLNNKLTICNRPDVAFPIFEYRHFILYELYEIFIFSRKIHFKNSNPNLLIFLGIKLQHPNIEFPFYR